MNASSDTLTAADSHTSGPAQPADERSPSARIVGIGASAGGLAAFEAFFSGLYPDATSDTGFVIVQHLAPDHESMLSELIARYTSMQVFEVKEGQAVQSNCVYVIPPNRDLTYAGGMLRLSPRVEPRGERLPIDTFFESLAEELGERAICVVLSGSGHDGTEGVMAIKRAGGLVLAQNPESAEYPDMPSSAIATGVVDFVLPPAEMAARILTHPGRSAKAASSSPKSSERNQPGRFEGVIRILRAQVGKDFSNYKSSTIERRIERRMSLQQISKVEDYERVLRSAPTEVDALFHDLLIGVTSFFRDPEAFDALEKVVIPALFEGRSADSVLRVWVPACSTGEEAYSIAILLREYAEAAKNRTRVQIFATDVDERAITTARSGVYPEAIAKDVSPDRLARHFIQQEEDGAYRVHKAVRDLLVFSEQDLTQDPPFSRLDLISCRNLLIYMDAELQSKLMSVFHYGLKPSGWLLLGTSETVGDFPALFTLVDKKAKLYRRQEGANPDPATRTARVQTGPPLVRERQPARKSPTRKRLPLRELTEGALLEDAPVAALVSEAGDVLYVHGQTGQYLQPAPGEMGTSILKMARDGLRHELGRALSEATTTGNRVIRRGVRVKTNGDFTRVDVSIKRVRSGSRPVDAALYLVAFEKAQVVAPLPGPDAAPAEGSTKVNSEPEAVLAARVAALTQELQSKDDYLHSMQEDMQRTNEDFRFANEELQSANEELQSTNEELETSKEELQSVNEELATVNAELQSKVSDLSRVNNDMNNLLAGTGVGTVFLDQELRVRRFTPAITQFINLIQSDIGRPIGHIVSNLKGYDRLVSDVQTVLQTLKPANVSVTTHNGTPYQLRIVPYRTSENVVDGAVVTFTEVMASEIGSSKQGDES